MQEQPKVQRPVQTQQQLQQPLRPGWGALPFKLEPPQKQQVGQQQQQQQAQQAQQAQAQAQEPVVGGAGGMSGSGPSATGSAGNLESPSSTKHKRNFLVCCLGMIFNCCYGILWA